ncbi:zinc finger 271-like [Solea senegalensis]|uniref:Zinc finger 271-like n=1 Tax=Solea senegalensis TaxID=28829 RepID=A0AAV6T4R1_SOLSE|nr:zinc finger and SCAN domain-containing protein 20 [Solea senegalensis]XP_043891125.1 zinc finger and SCAN domain-containing protein 20 [Solea senegalensis]KAG7524455.1 zinc finger 271-like [Solea senegalensis]
MENCSFQSQLLSVMEVLAKAAVAEINRRVDDSCAVLRLEVSQSQRDIELLKSKCETMEAELRRSRVRRARRSRVVDPPAADRFPLLVKVVLNKERQSADWDRHMQAEAPDQLQQCADVEPTNEGEHVQIKEECAEDDVWRKNSENKLSDSSPAAQTDNFMDCYSGAEEPADPDSLVSLTADSNNSLPEHKQLNTNQNEIELIVKHETEEEPDENAALTEADQKSATGEGDDQLWLSSLCRDASDPSFIYDGQQFEQSPTGFTPQSGLHLDDTTKPHSVLVNSAQVKRPVRTFRCKRPNADEELAALSQLNSTEQSSIPEQSQHHYRDFAPPVMVPNPAPSSLCGHNRSGFSFVRRMRAPWRSGIGEKRFSCTYCDKSFMRFSQLKEHLRSHTGEKPFSCLQCGRSFTKQCNLIRHAVVHSGEKPYKCSLCGKCFTQRSSLKSHQKTAH